MRTNLLLVLTCLAALGFAPAPFPKTERQRGQDLTDVAGTFEFLKYETSGRPEDSSKNSYNIEMTKDSFTFVGKNGSGRTKYDMRLDPGTSPPSFTWSMSNRVMFVGSYRVQRDQVTMIFRSGTEVGQRPTDFGSNPEYHYVMRRIRR